MKTYWIGSLKAIEQSARDLKLQTKPQRAHHEHFYGVHEDIEVHLCGRFWNQTHDIDKIMNQLENIERINKITWHYHPLFSSSPTSPDKTS